MRDSFQVPPYLSPVGAAVVGDAAVDVEDVVVTGLVADVVADVVVVAGFDEVSGVLLQATSIMLITRIIPNRINNVFFIQSSA